MTETKMVKILFDLASKNDYSIFYLIDTWQEEESKRVREIIKISDLAEEFKKKEGRFYNQYKLSSNFRELVKHIEKGEEMKIKCFYKDTYETFIKKWEEKHPGEKYEEYIKKRREQNRKDYLKYMSTFGFFGSGLGINNQNILEEIKKYYY